MKHTITPLHLVAVALAVAASACDSTPTRVGPIAPSSSPIVNATILPSTGPTVQAFTGFLCSVPSAVLVPASPFFLGPPRFDLVIVASQTVDFSRLTLQLIDGSHVGGPMVTFPQPLLNSTFGSTRVVAGSTRTFSVQPNFACPTLTPAAVAANLEFVDLSGSMHTATASAPLH